MKEQKDNGNVIYLVAGFAIFILIIIVSYLIYAHAENKYPFEPYSVTTDKNSKLTPLIPGAKPVDLTAAQLKNRDSYFPMATT